MKRSLFSIIRELESACGIEPATTREHFKTTSELEKRDYIKWLARQAPATASFIVSSELL